MGGESVSREDIRDQLLSGSKIRSNVMESVDVVVVGSGPGGAVVGKELAEAGFSVAIIEEGGFFDHKDFNQNASETFLKMYRDGASTLTMGRPPISLPIGKTVGGTATINSGTCFRLPDWVLRKWAILHDVADASPEQLAPFFQKAEDTIHATVLPEEVWGKNAKVVQRGALELGLSFKPLVHNAQGCKGCGVCTLGCPDGAKESPNVNYIPMALKAGAKVYIRTRIERILTQKGRAVGVSGQMLDEEGVKSLYPIEIKAKVVIIAAGALHTPALLMHNKLANNSRQLGKNLSIHPASRVAAEFEEEIRCWEGVPQGTYIDDFAKDGIMLEGIAVPPAVAAPILPFVGMEQKKFLTRYPHLASYGVMISDTSKGRVKNFKLKPIVSYNLNKFDAKSMIRALAIISKIFFAAGAKRVFPTVGNIHEIREKDLPALEDRKPNPSDLEMMAFHPLGTCRMGADPKRSVVDSNLECHDVKNLFISDASVFPSSLGVNPMLTIMAFAGRLAGFLSSPDNRNF